MVSYLLRSSGADYLSNIDPLLNFHLRQGSPLTDQKLDIQL